MKDLILHDAVRKQLDDFITKPSHAVMLIGPDGSGKRTLSIRLAEALLKLEEADSVLKHPYFLIIEPQNGTISIESVRQLHEHLRLKTVGSANLRRIIVVESAHAMTTEAQNAFLKILEEPPEDTVIILTVSGQKNVLPTIYSRAQHILIKPSSRDKLVGLLVNKGYDEKEVVKAIYLSNGRIGLLKALLEQDSEHPLAAAIKHAKEILISPTYMRLIEIESLAKDKQKIHIFLEALQRISRAALQQSSSSGREKDIKKWHSILKSVFNTQKLLDKNANTKLLLTDLMFNL